MNIPPRDDLNGSTFIRNISWSQLVPPAAMSPAAMSPERIWIMFADFQQLEKCSVIQRMEMRKAFMAGFTECFKVITDYIDDDVMDDNACMAFLTRMQKLCNKEVDKLIAEWRREKPI